MESISYESSFIIIIVVILNEWISMIWWTRLRYEVGATIARVSFNGIRFAERQFVTLDIFENNSDYYDKIW